MEGQSNHFRVQPEHSGFFCPQRKLFHRAWRRWVLPGLNPPGGKKVLTAAPSHLPFSSKGEGSATQGPGTERLRPDPRAAMDRWRDRKMWNIGVYNGIFFSKEKEGNPAVWNMAGPRRLHGNWSEPCREYCMISIMCGLLKKKVELLNTKCRMVVTRWGVWGRGNGQMLVRRYKP